MKKVLWIVAVIVVLLGAGFGVKAVNDRKNENQISTLPADIPVEAETNDASEVYMLSGQITEITDEYILIDGTEQGTIQANLLDDTIFDGLTHEELAVGQYAQILYDGKMTRSIPAQVAALAVDVYAMEGTVAEVQEDGRVLIDRTDVAQQVIVSLPEGVELNVGDSAVFYTTGISTMSLPAQMNAIGVVKK